MHNSIYFIHPVCSTQARNVTRKHWCSIHVLFQKYSVLQTVYWTHFLMMCFNKLHQSGRRNIKHNTAIKLGAAISGSRNVPFTCIHGKLSRWKALRPSVQYIRLAAIVYFNVSHHSVNPSEHMA